MGQRHFARELGLAWRSHAPHPCYRYTSQAPTPGTSTHTSLHHDTQSHGPNTMISHSHQEQG